MLVRKVKHGKRKYIYGGRGVISNIINHPLTHRLAAAVVRGAVQGLVSRKRKAEEIINGPTEKVGRGVVLD